MRTSLKWINTFWNKSCYKSNENNSNNKNNHHSTTYQFGCTIHFLFYVSCRKTKQTSIDLDLRIKSEKCIVSFKYTTTCTKGAKQQLHSTWNSCLKLYQTKMMRCYIIDCIFLPKSIGVVFSGATKYAVFLCFFFKLCVKWQFVAPCHFYRKQKIILIQKYDTWQNHTYWIVIMVNFGELHFDYENKLLNIWVKQENWILEDIYFS